MLGDDAIATNQVEIHPYLQTPKLRDYARARGLVLTAYEPLVRGQVVSDPVLRGIGERHGVGPRGGGAGFPDGGGAHRDPGLVESRPTCAANLAAPDVRLDATEMEAIRALDRGYRTIDPAKAPQWDD